MHIFVRMARALLVSDRTHIPAAVRRDVDARVGLCPLCGRPILAGEETEPHHWESAEAGGPSTRENLGRVHKVCNRGVGDRPRDAAIAYATKMYPTLREGAERRAKAREELPSIYMGRLLG